MWKKTMSISIENGKIKLREKTISIEKIEKIYIERTFLPLSLLGIIGIIVVYIYNIFMYQHEVIIISVLSVLIILLSTLVASLKLKSSAIDERISIGFIHKIANEKRKIDMELKESD